MGKSNANVRVLCSSLCQSWCCFVFKLCKLITMNPVKEKRKKELFNVKRQKDMWTCQESRKF